MYKKFQCLLVLFFLLLSFSSLKVLSKTDARISTNEDGFAFVSGIDSNKLLVLSPYGQIINKISLPDKIKNVDYVSSCPCGGYILLADSQNGIALTLDDRSGKQLLSFPSVKNPGAVSISRHKVRYIAIADTKKNLVAIFTETGSLVREIQGGSRFRQANQIILDQDNYLWILDQVSNKILRMDIQGKVLLTIQANRSIPMQMALDIDVDEEKRLHVLDKSGKVLVFSFQGKLQESRDLLKTIQTQALCFSVNAQDHTYRVISTGSQYFQLDTQLGIHASIPNLGTEKQKKVIVLRIGSRIMEHLGIDATLIEESPFIDPASNRSMVPIRAIAEIFGAEVKWNATKREISISWNKKLIVLTINSDLALIDGAQYKMDARPVIRKDRTFVPLRFISEAFGAQIQWYAQDQKIVISL
jgi:hypothetical protein